MFGNLFNQNSDSENKSENNTPEVRADMTPKSNSEDDFFGGAKTPPQQSTPPAQMPSTPPSDQTPSQDDLADQAGKLTSSPVARENMTALSRLDPRSVQVLHQAEEIAKKNQQGEIWPGHLLYGLLYDSEIFKLLEGFNVDVAKISQEIESKQTKGNFSGSPRLNSASTQILDEAYNTAKLRGSSFISPEDIMLAIFSAASTAEYLSGKGIQKDKLEQTLSKSGSYTVAKKSMIEKYSIDLTEEAKQGSLDPVTGRDREVERLVHILLRRSKNNPILIGEAGVGKTAIVEGLAQKIVSGAVPQDLAGRRIMQLDLASLIAGASHRGEFEERFRSVIKEAQASGGQMILFIDEIHTIIGAGDDGGALDASNIIKPYLARGQIQLIGTTTIAEFRKYFEKDKAFERRFQSILVDEPDEPTAVEMLKVLTPKYEKFHKVTYSQEAIEASVHLSKKYVGERFLPDKAVDLLDEAGADVKLMASQGKKQDSTVKKEDIEKVVAAWTGIPVTKLTEDESQKLIHMEDLIHKRFVDQEEAVAAIAEAIRRGRIGLSAANRPIASFIFLGPTGVGKTELAKTMAEILFGKEESMIRLDMSEYMEKHEVSKLIGAPPGYVGYEEGGQLTEAVRAKPYSIVLLDEVEKAHPDVFNILLQLLEDGRLTDNKGNTISFKNTVIIATSNIGSQTIQKELAEGGANLAPEEFNKKFAALSKTLMEELHKFFRPELLNRFDELVVFKPLAQKDMISIAKLNIGKTRKLLLDQGFELQISEQALGQLAKEGYDPVYGARPLRRLIQSAIENPISLQIISKNFVAGDVILINYDATKNEFTFTKVQKNATAGVPQGQPGAMPVQAQQPPTPTSQSSQQPPSNGSLLSSDPLSASNGNPSAASPTTQTGDPLSSGGTQMQRAGMN
ncbi:MAG TPA: AAA family ATPase [Patescibacteria group bacterium]|nr:AAA family ATPase [Patescibacteria group bacterium]